jgi:hypothetical protein
VFADLAFPGALIDLHALFSYSEMDSPLKFESPVDQILKEVDHEADTKDELDRFRHFLISDEQFNPICR